MIYMISQNIYGIMTLLNLFLIKTDIESFLPISNAPETTMNKGTLTSLKEFRNKE